MRSDYKVWFPDDGGTEADDLTVMWCLDAEDAAEEAVREFASGPDWESHIDGKPVRVCVRDDAGNVTTWLVQVATDITYTATEEAAGGTP